MAKGKATRSHWGRRQAGQARFLEVRAALLGERLKPRKRDTPVTYQRRLQARLQKMDEKERAELNQKAYGYLNRQERRALEFGKR